MDIEAYCDESRQEGFAKAGQPIKGYTLIGSLWIETQKRAQYNAEIKQIRQQYNHNHEFKWTRITPKNLDCYLHLIQLFFAKDMDFRCIVLPVKDLNAVEFHEADNELMFYKFYYQVLNHWIQMGNRYRIYLDLKTSRMRHRLQILHECLSNANPFATIQMVQALPSSEVSLIQLSDILIGAVGYKFHHERKSAAKLIILKEIETRLGHPIGPTPRDFQKFNIFRFRPRGEW